jgi:5-methylcytosine-specific restriction endonuclease McrBC regulatory subunit McrC
MFQSPMRSKHVLNVLSAFNTGLETNTSLYEKCIGWCELILVNQNAR